MVFIVFLASLMPIFGLGKEVIWEKNFDAGYEDISYGITIDSKQNVLVTGNSIDPVKRNRDFYTIKYDNDGKIIWEKRLDIGTRDESRGIATDSEDNIVITGAVNEKIYTVKYNQEGDILWQMSFNGGNGDLAYGVEIDSDDNIIVAGRSKRVVYDYFIIKYDKDGKMLWRTFWTNGEDDVIYDIALDSNDNIIVTGFSSNGVNHKGRGAYTYYAIKYDKNGKKLWGAKWGKPYYAESYGVSVDSKDNIVFTGFVFRNNNYDIYTLKCDPNGKILWEDYYSRSNYDKPYAIAIDSKNNIVIVGTTLKYGSNYDFLILRYDEKGKLISENLYDFGGNDIAYGVTVDSQDNVYITGGSRTDSWDYKTIKLKY